MRKLISLVLLAMLPTVSLAESQKKAAKKAHGIRNIETVVVIYAENRSFDSLYGLFPGANRFEGVDPAKYRQRDRDGSVLPELPPIWKGLTAAGVTPALPESQTGDLPNQPFAIDDPKGFNLPLSVRTRDLWHRFYQNQMQIHGGRNDKFAAYADSGALVMGYYDGTKLPMWPIARQYTLADNFFMGAFGGSFLNHFWLICACTPIYPDADKTGDAKLIAAVEDDGVSLKLAADSPPSAIQGPPKFVVDGAVTPKLLDQGARAPEFYAVNTLQPPYQPSAVKPAPGGDPAYADPQKSNRLPPQSQKTIGDLLSAKGITWAWYAGGWQAALEGNTGAPAPIFQFHHQPFNYFSSMAPGTKERSRHLRDGGLGGSEFIKAIDAGELPQVTFYKPQGNLNEHPDYAAVLAGDEHIADIIVHLQKSPQWEHMLVIVTYDENGGFWDHVAPPRGDRWGPASRIATIIISPFARKGFVDHTFYDTTSILRFITRRFALPVLPGLAARDKALAQHGSPAPGDLTKALVLP